MAVNSTFHPPIVPPTLGDNGSFWTFELVEERIIDAVELLDRHVPSGRWPFAGDAPWHLVVRDNRAALQADGDAADYVETETFEQAKRRFGLRASEIARMEQTLRWVEFLPPKGEMRKLVHEVAMFQAKGRGSRVLWREIKAAMRSRQTPDALRMTYSRSIAAIAAKLNARRIPVSC